MAEINNQIRGASVTRYFLTLKTNLLMEITNEIKQQVFALYLNERVAKHEDLEDLAGCSPLDIFVTYAEAVGMYSLFLKTLSSISDEDAIEVAGILGGSTHLSDESKIHQVNQLLNTPFFTGQTNISASSWLNCFDFLRSKGYALPALGFSVHQLVSAGVIKLIKN